MLYFSNSLQFTQNNFSKQREKTTDPCASVESISPCATLLRGYKFEATLAKISCSFEIIIMLL